MITVSSDFKTQQKAETKTIRAYLTDNAEYPDQITESDDLKSIKITAKSGLLRSVMRQAEAVYLGSHDYLDEYVNLGMGVDIPTYEDDLTKPIYDESDPPEIIGYYQKVASVTPEYIDYGSFQVVESTTDIVTGNVTLKMFDKMYEANQPYSLSPSYPITLLQLLQAICTELSWTLATTSFPNDDLEITEELFSELKLTYRQVLDQIAEASGSMVYFDVNDELTLSQIETSGVVETLTTSEELNLRLQPEYTDINSLVASRMPQEDNVLVKDDDSIALNGLQELKLINNYIIDPDRETYLVPIFAELLGLNFAPFKVETIGLGYLQLGDRIEVTDTNSVEYETIVLEWELRLDGGIRETFSADVPDKSNTNYSYAGIVGERIKNTELIVNKQEGYIESLVSDVEDNIASITDLLQTAENLSLSVSRVGGVNLLINSVGLKGTLEEWQTLDENGDPIDARNDAVIDVSSDIQENTESGSAFLIENQFLSQTINTIVGETYSLYLRFKRSTTANVTITGVGTQEITTEGYSPGEWADYSVSWEATGASATIRFENTSGYCYLSDILAKKGDATGWSPAPNEVYGSNYLFDREGLSLTSQTNTFKTVIDNTSLKVYDTATGKLILEVSKDRGKVKGLVAQDDFTIQKYEDPTKSLRFIPTDSGVMAVINE